VYILRTKLRNQRPPLVTATDLTDPADPAEAPTGRMAACTADGIKTVTDKIDNIVHVKTRVDQQKETPGWSWEMSCFCFG
jgi:hypothetical protein